MTRASDLLRIVQRYWLLLFFSACTLLIVIYLQGLIRSTSLPKHPRPIFLFATAAFQIAVWMVLAASWKLVVKYSTSASVSFRAALFQYSILNFGKYIPGKVWGMIARASHLAKHDLSRAEIAGATIYEQVFVFHSAAVVSIAFGSISLHGYSAWTLGVAALAILFSGPYLGAFGLKIIDWVFVALGKNETHMAPVRIPATPYFCLLGSYMLAWILQGLVLVSLFYVIRPATAELELTTVFVVISANTISMIIGFVAIFAPAGIGVRELTLIPILASVSSPTDAILLSVAMRVWTVTTDLAFGGIALLAGSRKSSP